MNKTSRKVVKKAKPAQKRSDHPAGCRVNAVELARIRADIAETAKGSGIPISLGAYTKHAILEHFRLRKIENIAKAIVSREDQRQDAEPIDSLAIIEELRAAVGE